ncbi:MAG: FeoA family protein [Sedimentisphaerales bacterium]|jgi:Fe2+ transport system protein FeoA
METTITRPLSEIEEGQTVNIIRIGGGRGLRVRLTALGLLPNTQVTVVHNGRSGPFVISVKNSKMALGRGIVDKIIVS